MIVLQFSFQLCFWLWNILFRWVFQRYRLIHSYLKNLIQLMKRLAVPSNMPDPTVKD